MMADFLSNDMSDLVHHIHNFQVEVSVDEMLDIDSGLDRVLEAISTRTWLNMLSWTSIPLNTAWRLVEILASERINRFRLTYLTRLPYTLITSRRSIQFLEATHISFSTNSRPSPDMHALTQIHHLDVFPNLSDFNLSIGSAISVMERLDTYLGCPDDISAFLEMVQRMPGSLSSVSLLLNDYDTFLENALTNAKQLFPLLSVREVTFVCGPAAFMALPALSPIVYFLQRVINPTPVEMITIRFVIALEEELLAVFLPSQDEGLSYLGRNILLDSFPSLRRIDFELFISIQTEEDSQRTRSATEETEACFESNIMSLFIPHDCCAASDIARVTERVEVTVKIIKCQRRR
ncbi:hypothetical protein CPB84DRAFT_1798050 [Gymnopilus junonius]|uniref:Uncharacterized protein n=1 Tax=Gymnopilus junonius TaxID=109634 RepID=A0A9P5N891_GYMJU|nr:hypothetical protein CPB84DRAFT_1798050 [Gymnopilus junonius]